MKVVKYQLHSHFHFNRLCVEEDRAVLQTALHALHGDGDRGGRGVGEAETEHAGFGEMHGGAGREVDAGGDEGVVECRLPVPVLCREKWRQIDEEEHTRTRLQHSEPTLLQNAMCIVVGFLEHGQAVGHEGLRRLAIGEKTSECLQREGGRFGKVCLRFDKLSHLLVDCHHSSHSPPCESKVFGCAVEDVNPLAPLSVLQSQSRYKFLTSNRAMMRPGINFIHDDMNSP
mmetsp:Transcript_74516/g.174893  ORF Transcript_74516/g.174893 Transcript_74516/m.174893 type:complete len:229 (+) Transcript_74516:25-711(+)